MTNGAQKSWRDYHVTFTIEACFCAPNIDDANLFVINLKNALMSGGIHDDEYSRRGCDVADVCEITNVGELTTT